jgi:hypothetical protein
MAGRYRFRHVLSPETDLGIIALLGVDFEATFSPPVLG